MPAIEVIVNNAVGLHARPASLFVREAAGFSDCDITVQNITLDGPVANAKSILKVLTLGVMQGHRIRVEANGEQAED
jgi:phosphotransferase system HPr (HPr) family protein